MCSRANASSSSKPTKGKRRLAGYVDYVALSRDLVDSVESGVYIIQSKKFVYVNPFFAKLTGYSREELIGMLSLKLVLPQDRPAVRKKATRNLKSRLGSKPYEYRFIKKNGEVMWVLERVSSIEYMGQKAALGNFIDITGRKKTEEALVSSEERYRAMLEQMQDSYYEVNLAGNFTFVSDSFCGNLGYAGEELVGNNYRLVAADKEIKPVFRAFNQVYRTGEPNKGFVNQVIRKDGSVKYYESSIAPLKNEQGEIIGFRCVGRDITGRKQLEEAVVKSEERYRTILEHLQDSYYEVDLAGNFTFVNESTGYSFGYSREELIGQNYRLVIPEEDIKGHFAAYNEVYRTGKPDKGFLHRIHRKDGSILFSEVSIDLRRNEQGDVIGFKSVSRDITERKNAEQALKESEERYRFITDNTADVVWALDGKLRYTYISPSITRQRGYTVEEARELNLTQVLTPESQDTVLKKLQVEMSPEVDGQSRRISTFTQDMEMYHKDGTTFWTETSVTVLRTPEGEFDGLLGVSRDITERKQLQQKLEEMATHDFLTGLPNRALLLDRFTIAAALAHRNKARLALMSLDLDNFKSINDTLGHSAGDQMLKGVSMRLTSTIRASDTLARVGGDEFILVTMETDHINNATAIAQKILDSFKEPFIIDGHELNISASIGIAIYPEDAEDMETLTKKSDAVMYYSKGHGGNQFKFFGDGDARIGGVD